MSTQLQQQAISGAALIIRCEGAEVGYAENLSGTITITNSQPKAFGDIDRKEIVPVDRSAEFTLRFCRLKNLPLTDQKMWPLGGTLEVLAFPYLTFEIVDQTDGRVIHTIARCKPKNLTFNCDAAGLFQENGGWDSLLSQPSDGSQA